MFEGLATYGTRKFDDIMVNKNKKNKDFIIGLFVVIMFGYLATNAIMVYQNYKNYKSKIEIVATMISGTDESNMYTAIKVLKEKNLESPEQGYEILNKYGYLEYNNNILFNTFRRQSIFSAAITFIIFFALMLVLYLWQNTVRKNEVSVLSKVEQNLIRFRENNMKVLEVGEGTDEQQKIVYELESLGSQLQLLREEARQEKEGTKELVADISHQLKTPISALDTSFSILLQENLSVEERTEFTKRCRNALDGLEILLQSLLQISRLEAGLIQIEKSQQSLSDIILIAVNRVYPKASEKNIELSFDCESSLEKMKIMLDKKWLSEALINVLDNAIKYSPRDSKIDIRLQKRNMILRIEIEDQGIGIPSEEYHKVFQRFFRGTIQQVKEANGSGIGLYLARKIIEEHHGTISVSSNWNRSLGTEKKYPGSTFLIQLQIGEFVAIVGKSGSGKSTLLHMLGGLDTPTSGEVLLKGKELYKMKEDELAVFRRRKIGFIFQAFNLVSSINVWENIVLPIGLDGKKVDTEYINDIIETLGIEKKIHNLPNTLSGGQQQRVAIARALASRPDILFADEPTGNLDTKTSDEVIALLKMSAKKYGQTIVMITHDDEIAQVADRILIIEDGRVVNFK